MATENILMQAVRWGGDRQDLHERIRVHSQAAGMVVKQEGKPNDLLARIAADPAFGLSLQELEAALQPEAYIGCSVQQVEDYLKGEAGQILARYSDVTAPEEALRV